MTRQKRSISFDESVLREMEQRVAESGGSLSAFVNVAVLRELRISSGIDLLTEDNKQLGVAPSEIRSRIVAEWPA
jgi:hypothetical protein